MSKVLVKPANTATETTFKFSDCFNKSFDILLKVATDAFESLSKAAKGVGIESDYGVCSCNYKLRYITPKNISEFVSNLSKGLSSNLFNDRVADVEMFVVASAKRFIEENGCVPFEESTAVDNANRYVNPKEATLSDLAYMCQNDMGNVAVYSKGEMAKRIELAQPDIKRLTDMHFTANIRGIVNGLPKILKDANSPIVYNPAWRNTFGSMVEEFILFACSINTIAALQMIAYCSPAVEYGKSKDDLVTECCMHKTNEFMIRNRLPFNFNMRDIVLADVTPTFKDVHDALYFIMRDGRSPITVLVNQFGSKQAPVEFDCDNIANMFLGMEHRCPDGTYNYRHGKEVYNSINPDEAAGFNTSVTWLDNIAFGNSFLDGNYRRDAVGNNHVHPIINTLDDLYRMFCPCHCKTNEEIANNIIRVACAMREIINRYRLGRKIENYDITKDVLTLLGDIFTRSCLKLYYNNTLVCTYTDDMPDAMAPMIMESFVLEADDPNAASVSFTNSQGQQTNLTAKGITSSVIQKFVQWVKSALSKLSGNFDKVYKKSIEWISNHKETNDAIAKAIDAGTFNVNLKNFPKYNLPYKDLIKFNLAGRVDGSMNMEKFSVSEFLFHGLTSDNEAATAMAKSYDEHAKNKNDQVHDPVRQWKNYLMYGTVNDPQKTDGKMSSAGWNEICSDLMNFTKATKAIFDAQTKGVEEFGNKIKTLRDSAKNKQGDEQQKMVHRIEEMESVSQLLSRVYMPEMNKAFQEFFKANYKWYMDIYNNYVNQTKSSNTGDQQQTQQQTNQTTPSDTPPAVATPVEQTGQGNVN